MASLDRRSLLCAAGAAAGLAALGTSAHARPSGAAQSVPPAAQPPSPRKLRKAVMIGMCQQGKTLLEKFQVLRDAGFDGVELDSPSNLAHDEVRAAMAATGLCVHGLVDSVHWSVPLNSPDAAERARAVGALETALRDARAYGASSVLLVPAVVDQRRPYDEAWKLSVEGIRKVLPLAEQCGVAIAVENVWNNFLLSPLEAARYVDEFEHRRVAFHFDIGNCINTGWPEQWIRILGARIAKLHVKDFSRKLADEKGKWAGFGADLLEGDAGWSEVLRALDEIGYTRAAEAKWWTAEVAGGDAARMRAIATKMDQILAL